MKYRLLLVFIVILIGVMAWSQQPVSESALFAQEEPTLMPTRKERLLEQGVEIIELGPMDENGRFLPQFTINAASDLCETAPERDVFPMGDQTNVFNADPSADDPVLTCMWGNPARDQGYHTVWYKMIAPDDGSIQVSTIHSEYDTVIGVFAGTCGNLDGTTLACSDDTNGFTSNVIFPVTAGNEYFVEIASWGQTLPGDTLTISAHFFPLEVVWEEAGNMPDTRSRIASVVVGESIYVLGGVTQNKGTPDPVTTLQRFDTVTGHWQTLANLPGTGYQHAAMAHVNGKLYVPVGDTAFKYSANHFVYDIGSNIWSSAPAVPWPNGIPAGYSAAVGNRTQTGYYLLGGTGTQDPLADLGAADIRSDVFFFNNNTQEWVVLPKMNVNGEERPRFGHSANLVGNFVCVVGGVVRTAQSTGIASNGLCYNSVTESWFATGAHTPRYGSYSAVGPNGHWYLLGGYNTESGSIDMIEEVEVYDLTTGVWTTLPRGYDLRRGDIPSERTWFGGGFIGEYLWILGGEIPGVLRPVQLIDTLYQPLYQIYAPHVANSTQILPAYDTFSTARKLEIGETFTQNFDQEGDLFDIYYFDLPQGQNVLIDLMAMPINVNYDIGVYTRNKFLWSAGTNLQGVPEFLSLNLPADRYYLVVERVFPTGGTNPADTYAIRVNYP